MTALAQDSVESLQWPLVERDQKIAYLEEQIAWLTRHLFGKKSERIVDTNQEQLQFDGFEAKAPANGEAQTVSAQRGKHRFHAREPSAEVQS